MHILFSLWRRYKKTLKRHENKWLAWLQPLLPTYFSVSIHFQNKTKSLDCFRKSIMLCSVTISLFLTSGQRGAWAREKLNLSFPSLWKSSAWFVGCQFVVFYLTMWWSQLIFMSHVQSMISWKIILCLGKWIKFKKAFIIALTLTYILVFSMIYYLSVKNKN